ncbi:ATP-dependent DNA helicase RecG [Clostridium estertheticum]|uniref:ATP-dependent DNA helicase RecG n=1 Tax=Clostridium estertheticum TaxID=238834 RepID=UPI001CF59BC1|nr:ATP-dependent DNA helicase RecG [Clostridium estertheticum]MCB2307986.1 ATP-dependent DNA helicase RecG [Clostridium estertheticum]MCB2346110.1 ATP-dependent DNA helicase RecG [Clostridium estertheticum]MCB2351472.1 ATP-dependent DNA helicase RecG [Clostridium estertheticum]WAG44638.1 ATP-dependent DNA helicase RecG [Clostridium estertheticum]
MDTYSDIKYVKGVGPKMAESLNKCGIFNVLDLLLYFPRDYENISVRKNILECEKTEKVIIECTVLNVLKDIRLKNNKTLSTIIFCQGDNEFKGKWFNQTYAKNSFKISSKYIITGKVDKFKEEITIMNPKIVKNTSMDENKIIATYRLKNNITNNFFNKIISDVLCNIVIIENLPKGIIEKYSFCSLNDAIRSIHSPKSLELLNEAKRRLKFQELFTYSLKILMLKEFIKSHNSGIQFKMAKELTTLKAMLPYNLTKAQSKVVREILIDQKKDIGMNRLLQGDVGSGKTIVAIITMFNVVKNGYQTAMMAPTEILAKQHYEEIKNILKGFSLNIQILSGSTTAKNKQLIKQDLKSGTIDIIVGTHALIEDNVEFENLGMIVTDEQHRFGVSQRNRFSNKGKNIDILVMTATPIPRTLSLYLYGDLDVSIIDELPPGRQKIDTSYESMDNSDKVYGFALEQINKGRQVYIVCPLVDENEEMKLSSVAMLYEKLKREQFKYIEVGMVYGKMPSKLKNEIMDKFKAGEIKALVSTTVIEVGVNVPNATVMIIENAERFGLAQLHQLRGRVGRGEHKSYCILLANIKNNVVRKRLGILIKSNDGFFIAEEDLKTRGAGELFGIRQHGESGLILSDVIDDISILKLANSEAKRLIQSDNACDTMVKNEILQKIELTSSYICFN